MITGRGDRVGRGLGKGELDEGVKKYKLVVIIKY